jgi:hypothetical protein
LAVLAAGAIRAGPAVACPIVAVVAFSMVITPFLLVAGLLPPFR